MRKNQILICKVRWLKYSAFSMLLSPLAPAQAHANVHEIDNVIVQKNDVRTLVGQVWDDELGEPLLGASILVKESNTGVITDMDGRFSVQIPMKGATIVISYLGYKTQTIKVTDQGVLNIRMLPDSEVLNEVVVVGAGTQKKRFQ
ncbi:MAG: carboxypeptidase-like regulatory domain-containing protein [Bacteroides intestinalis]|nr:carboxypeptidase-like regulatory domain-containing protein [Bacteroides intestinalis]